jgi:hypothetical protein
LSGDLDTRCLSLKGTALQLGVSPRWLHELVRVGEAPPSIVVRGRRLFTPAGLQDWMSDRLAQERARAAVRAERRAKKSVTASAATDGTFDD